MGVWGTGNFSNDTAVDFFDSIASMDDLMRPIHSVTAEPLDSVDADLASEALAAADLLAGILGRPATDLPKEAQTLITKFDQPSIALLTQARDATVRVLESSELAQLWGEEDGPAWQDVIGDLLERLDPNTEYKSKDHAIPLEGGFVCSICETFIPDHELTNVEIDIANMPGITSGWYFHRSCIEDNFEPPHFNKHGAVEDPLKEQIEQFLHDKNNDSADP